MPLSKFDKFYRAVLFSKYFVKGWGKPDCLKRLFEFRKVVSNRDLCFKLVPRDYPVQITKEEEWSDCRIIEGHFKSPFIIHLPGLLPPEAENAYFQAVLPKKWSSDYYKPVCIHMAGTGDHYFWRRRKIMAQPLLKRAEISSIILENPFYGLRKPKDQVRSILHNVSDIFVMGGCLIMEALVLLHWSERQGLGPLGLTGMSMGGHMASLAATNWPKPIVVVPCLSWSTASGVFTEGVLSGAINWDLLQTQYKSDDVYKADLQKMVTVIEDDAFRAGQQFAKAFPHSLDQMEEVQQRFNNKGKKSGYSLEENINVIVEEQGKSVLLERNVNESGLDSQGESKFINIGGLFKFSAPNLSKLKLINSDDRSNIMNSLNESDTKVISTNCSMNWREHEALHFMRGIMDECTHLRNFSVPVDTSLIIAVCARDDGYVPREGVTHLADIWPGAEVRYLDAGHVAAFILHQKMFRNAIIEAFERAKKKYVIREDTS